jgi:tetratricopeptide (TPR) repeat protein
MRRLCLLGAAAGLALSAWLAPGVAGEGRGTLGSIGASMGGLRVMVIDALFLRAEAQRKVGRIEDAAALYETVLELDPANEAATVFLVNAYVDDLMPQVPDVDERFGWWREARALLTRALTRRPDSAVLHFRAATLILDATLAEPAFAARLVDELGLPRLVALRHLRRAARMRANLPRGGYGHLLRLALLAPAVATAALEGGQPDAYAEAAAAAMELLRLRGDVLARMGLDEEPPPDLGTLLRAQIEAVDAVRSVVWGGGPPGPAREKLAALRALLPGIPLLAPLETLLRR